MEEINDYLKNQRQQYDSGILKLNQLDENPIRQFESWFKSAVDAGVPEPNAMNLSTVSGQSPTSRIVLLKGVENNGFVFFTNYESRKGAAMAENPRVCLTFFWQPVARQVRIEGMAEKISPEESDIYFNSRPRESQIGAWASAQSRILKSREDLDLQTERFSEQFRDQPVPRPLHWGGYIVKPSLIEFWQGRPDRLHDRFLYELTSTGWEVFRLAP